MKQETNMDNRTDTEIPWASRPPDELDTLRRDLATERARGDRLQRELTDAERRATAATLALGSGALADALAQEATRKAVSDMQMMAAELRVARRELAAERFRLDLERKSRSDERAAELQLRARFPLPGVEIACAGGGPEDGPNLAALAEREAGATGAPSAEAP